MIFALILGAVKALTKGQDPYAILGVERLATKKQITDAFRKKTRLLHPDVNKDPSANRKWILVNDAYELLSDDKARERFDKFGLIDEALQEAPKPGFNRADKIKDILARDSSVRSKTREYGEFDHVEHTETIIDLTDRTFDTLTNDGRPWVIYCYQNSYDEHSNRDFLNDLYQRTGLLFGIARLSVAAHPKTAQLLELKTLPQIVFYDKHATPKLAHFTGTPNLRSVTRFAARKYGADITTVKGDEDIVVWRKKQLDKVHIILYSDLKEPPSSYYLAAAFLKRQATFAFGSITQANLVNYPRALGSLTIEELPTYIFYRMGTPKDDTFGGPVTPLVAPLDLDAGQITAIVRQYGYPVFAELNAENLDRLCPDYCIIHVRGADIAEDIKIGVNDMNLPTGAINGSIEREFVEKFGLVPGDFFVMKRKTKEYAIWKDVFTWGEFRRTIEFMRNGLAKFKRIDSFPNFTDPRGTESQIARQQFKERLDARMDMVRDQLHLLIVRIKALPATVFMLIVALLVIGLGELITFLVKKMTK